MSEEQKTAPYGLQSNNLEADIWDYNEEDDSDPFDILPTKSAAVDRLKRWRQAAVVLNASRRFRYTLDLKKEEEKKRAITKIRTHAQVIRAALLFQAAGQQVGAEIRDYSSDENHVWLGIYNTVEEAVGSYDHGAFRLGGQNAKLNSPNRVIEKGETVCIGSTSASGQKSQQLPDDHFSVSRWLDDMDLGSGMCLGGFANDTGGGSSQSNKFTAQEEDNIAQPHNGTYTFQHFPSVEIDWDAMRDAILYSERVAAGNKGNKGDEVVKELPVQDAGYAMNAESQSSNFQTEKSPPLRETIEIQKDLLLLDHSHQLPKVEDSVHKEGLVVGAEIYDSCIHALDKTCTEETSKGKSPENVYSYDILSAHFGKLQDDAAKYFDVSRSTFKRICRDHGIKRWPSHKKKLDSQSPCKLRRVNNEEPSRKKSYCSGISPLQDADMITVKATYKEIAIKFEVLDSSGMIDLEDNVIERLKMERGTFSIKYQDDEGDWVLIACDKDLQKCMKTSRLLKKTTIKMLVDRPINHYAS
ncbi:hypothetical protein POM88_002652 [Heracleum sosnowskyi]|uniref:Uncharacterized protein n=1 Tax=Heracleum sosnowskyi TaxID=360622 RepID=A0AAD8JIC3_9APIA|nr:hypothetical protein POM88_002652 [Heracleum sosnowskyi]